MRPFGTRTFHIYLMLLAGLYFLGAILHLLDIFDLRLRFSELSFVWQIWIVYLFVFDSLAAVGLWKAKRWGVIAFLMVAISQLIAYIGFSSIFGDQLFLVVFHIITLALFLFLLLESRVKKVSS